MLGTIYFGDAYFGGTGQLVTSIDYRFIKSDARLKLIWVESVFTVIGGDRPSPYTDVTMEQVAYGSGVFRSGSRDVAIGTRSAPRVTTLVKR